VETHIATLGTALTDRVGSCALTMNSVTPTVLDGLQAQHQLTDWLLHPLWSGGATGGEVGRDDLAAMLAMMSQGEGEDQHTHRTRGGGGLMDYVVPLSLPSVVMGRCDARFAPWILLC
jgi:hypothetical protein